MQGSFEYMAQTTYLDTITVDNIGECCIEAFNDLGQSWYLWVTTKLGKTKVLEYGPYFDGIKPDSCYCSFMKFDYSDMKVDRIINKFLNNTSRRITQTKIVDPKDIIDYIVPLKEYMDE